MNDTAKASSEAPASIVPPRPAHLVPTPPKRERATLAKSLPTDRVTVDKQVEIIRAYAAVFAANNRQPVSNEQVGEIVGLSGSTVSQTNSFFTDIGLVSRADDGTGFIPSAEVIEYNNACQWDLSEARAKLRPLFERTWFYRCLVPRLQLAPQSQATCLALLAGESKAQADHNERLLKLIGFLEVAGIVSISNGNISLVQHRALPIQPKPDELKTQTLPPNTPKVFSDHEENSFFLDKEKKKRITLISPLFLTRAEFKRLTTWIESTLIVEDEQKS